MPSSHLDHSIMIKFNILCPSRNMSRLRSDDLIA